MKNCVLFRIGDRRFAIELKWVREVVPIGHVTAIGHAGPALLGAIQLHGTIAPLVSAAQLTTESRNSGPDSVGVVIECEGTTVVLAIHAVEQVTTIRPEATDVELLAPQVVIDATHEAIATSESTR